MIDRTSRDKLAETLRKYVSGRVTNDMLDDLEINNEDFGVKAIKEASWFLYDDLYEHKAVEKNRIEKEDRHEVSKWILFLQSDEEYLWPKPSIFKSFVSMLTLGLYKSDASNDGDKEAWPFFKNENLKNALANPKLFAGKAHNKTQEITGSRAEHPLVM